MRLNWLFALIYIIFNILFIMTGEGLISGPRVLCLDGGGLSWAFRHPDFERANVTSPAAQRIKFYIRAVAVLRSCGTSTGGLIAILLGRLGKILDEHEAMTRTFGSNNFSGNRA